MRMRRWQDGAHCAGLFYIEEGREVPPCVGRLFRQVHYKKGHSSSTSVTNTYTPSEGEKQLMQASADYARRVAPNAYYLNDVARNVLENSLGTVQVDFNNLNNNAQNTLAEGQNALRSLAMANAQNIMDTNNKLGDVATSSANLAKNTAGTLGSLTDIYKNSTSAANNTLGQLAGGNLPSQYQSNMEKSIASALTNTMGKTLSNLGNRGVVNSSVTTRSMDDISKNAADAVAKQYQQNINQVAGLAQQQLGNATNMANNVGNVYNQQYDVLSRGLGQQAQIAQNRLDNLMNASNTNAGLYSGIMDSAAQPIAIAASAQEAAQQPAMNLWNMSLGLNGANTSALAGVAGKGSSTQTTTQRSSGGNFLSGLFGGVLNGAADTYGSLWCFPRETKIKMADGSEKMIAHVEVGEKVMSLDTDGKETPATVLHKLDHHADMTYNVCCKHGHCITTLSQPLMNTQGAFVLVRDLRMGDVLKGGGRVTGVIEAGDRPLYDLQTDGENIYIANGFIAQGGDASVWGTKEED